MSLPINAQIFPLLFGSAGAKNRLQSLLLISCAFEWIEVVLLEFRVFMNVKKCRLVKLGTDVQEGRVASIFCPRQADAGPHSMTSHKMYINQQDAKKSCD